MRRAPFDGWVKRDGVLEVFYPRNAQAGPAVDSQAAAWGWSAYAQLVASTGTPFVPHVAHLRLRANLLTSVATVFFLEYELATGAAGSEVPFFRHVQAFAGSIQNPGADSLATLDTGLTMPCGATLIPSGTRIAHRIRCSQANSVVSVRATAYLGGYDGGAAPASYRAYGFRAHLAGVHGALTNNSPSGATLNVTPAAFPNYGAWVQVLASAPRDLLFWGAAKAMGTIAGSSQGVYLEVATGAAGSEVARARIAYPDFGGGTPQVQHLIRPVLVKAGERLAVRATGSSTAHPFMFFWEEV